MCKAIESKANLLWMREEKKKKNIIAFFLNTEYI